MRRAVLGASVGWVGISMVADGVPSLLLPYVLARGGGSAASELGTVTMVAIGLAAVVQPAAGAWSDRVGRLPAMAVGAAITALGLVLVLDPATLAAGAVLALGGVSVAQAGQQALLPDVVPASWRGRAAGLKSAFDVAGALVAFAVLAAMLGGGDAAAASLFLGGGLVGALVVAALLVRPAEQRPRAGKQPRSILDAYRLDIPARPLVTLIVARFLFLLGIYAVGRFLVLFVAERGGVSAEAAAEGAGIALAVLAATTVLASFPAGWAADRVGRRALMAAGGAIAAVGIALLPLATSVEAVIGFGALLAVGSAAFSAGSWAALADETQGADSGRLMGIANVGTAGAAALAGAFGSVIDGPGFGVAFAIAAAAAAIGGVVGFMHRTRGDARAPVIGSWEGTP